MIKHFCKEHFLIVIILISLASCSNHTYQFDLHSNLSDTDLELIKYVPISESLIDSSEVLKQAYYMLSNNQYNKLSKYLSKQDSNSCDYILASIFYHFAMDDFEKANYYYSRVCAKSPIFVRDLIKQDIQYELDRKDGTIDYDFHIENYQTLLDSYDDEFAKKIITLRARKLRYSKK